MSNSEHSDSLQSRDGVILRMLGGFFVAFGVLVWLGLFWDQPSEGRIVSLGSGAVLTLVGIASFLLGKRSTKQSQVSGE